MGKQWKQWLTSFEASKITADGDCSHEIKRRLLLGRKVMTNLGSILKSRDIPFPTKGLSSQGYGFSNSPYIHVWMWEVDCKESWAPKNWCFWTVVLEKTLEWTYVDKVMSLIFNMLSMLIIIFLPRCKHLLISWLQSPSAVILEPKKIKSVTVSIFSSSICHEVIGLDAKILAFWMLSFKPTF